MMFFPQVSAQKELMVIIRYFLGVSLDPPLERGPHFGGDLAPEIEVVDVSDSSSKEENTLPKVTKISMASYIRPNFNLTEAVFSSRNAEYCFKRHEAIRIASRYWKAAGIPAQKAWNAHAVLLNTLSPAGVFISRPPGIRNFVSLALRSLTFELDALRSMARFSLLRRPKKESIRANSFFWSRKGSHCNTGG